MSYIFITKSSFGNHGNHDAFVHSGLTHCHSPVTGKELATDGLDSVNLQFVGSLERVKFVAAVHEHLQYPD